MHNKQQPLHSGIQAYVFKATVAPQAHQHNGSLLQRRISCQMNQFQRNKQVNKQWTQQQQLFTFLTENKTKWNWTSSGIIGHSEILQQNASYTDATL